MTEFADAVDMQHENSITRSSESTVCERCAHPSWMHGPGGICADCDASHHATACGLLTLYGFDLSALPLADEAFAASA